MSVERGLFLVLISIMLCLLTAVPYQYAIASILVIFLYKKAGVRFSLLFISLVVFSYVSNLVDEPDQLCGTIVDKIGRAHV